MVHTHHDENKGNFDEKREKCSIEKRGLLIKTKAKNDKTMSFCGPFFRSKMSFWRFDKKGANDGKSGTKKIFFRPSLFAGADLWKRGARAKQDLDTAVITHSRPPNPCRSPCLGPKPSTDEKRQLKDDNPGIPMISSKVALAFHSGYRRPQNCFSVGTRGKIQNTFLVL